MTSLTLLVAAASLGTGFFVGVALGWQRGYDEGLNEAQDIDLEHARKIFDLLKKDPKNN